MYIIPAAHISLPKHSIRTWLPCGIQPGSTRTKLSRGNRHQLAHGLGSTQTPTRHSLTPQKDTAPVSTQLPVTPRSPGGRSTAMTVLPLSQLRSDTVPMPHIPTGQRCRYHGRIAHSPQPRRLAAPPPGRELPVPRC